MPGLPAAAILVSSEFAPPASRSPTARCAATGAGGRRHREHRGDAHRDRLDGGRQRGPVGPERPLGGGIVISGGTTTLRTPPSAATSSTSTRAVSAGRWHLRTSPRRAPARPLVTRTSPSPATRRRPAAAFLPRRRHVRHDLAHDHLRQPGRQRLRRRPQQLTADHNIADDASCGFGGAPANALGSAPGEQRRPDRHARARGDQPGGQRRHELPATDQRGVARAQGACDIGAFEFVPAAAATSAPRSCRRRWRASASTRCPRAGTVRIKLPGHRQFVRARGG